MLARTCAAAVLLTVLAVAVAALAPACGDDAGSCVRAPGCPTSDRCCNAQSVCQSLVCQGIRYICRGEGGGFAWRADDACAAEAGTVDATLDAGPRADSDAAVDATPDGPSDGAADGQDSSGDGTPRDATVDGPKPDAGCQWGSTGNNADPCSGVPAETWRCVFTSEFGGTTVSQVCRNNVWLNFELTPRDCPNCCGTYSLACKQ